MVYYSLLLTLALQANVERWEQADTPWVLPTYVGNFSQDFAVNWEWIKNGGVTDPTTVVAIVITPLTLSQPQDVSDGDLEVKASDEALPLLLQIMPKVKL